MSVSKKSITEPLATAQNFPIVGIGASAGGLIAFKQLLQAIPEISGMAYVLVQHLDPNHDSILPEILQKVTKIPVHEITDEIHLAPDHIYIIPENKMLISTDGILQLSPRNKKTLNLAIDLFFTTLAEVHTECAIGVVLSGTGKDGTDGLKAIKKFGGICIAQDIATAAYSGMPQSAIDAGVVDFILAPEAIPEQLLKINKTLKASHVFDRDAKVDDDEELIFKQIIGILQQRKDVDFSYYKRPTLQRRIARRIALVNKNTIAEYLIFLKENTIEQDALFQDVLIPVTSFLRNPKTFQNLKDTFFPILFKNKPVSEPFRVWIAGCSTGEEAYSMAICLHEFLEDNFKAVKIQIFASDISEKAIKKARLGVYTKEQVEGFSAAQLEAYFIKNDGIYEVRKFIREMCIIATHNFLKDPPFAKMDLISCRNVLIYMNNFLQKKAFATFHYALKENGYLLLGKSESVGAFSELFAQVDKNEKIFTRKPNPNRFIRFATERKSNNNKMTTKSNIPTLKDTSQTDFRKSAETIMISKAPACVVVNEHFDIVHIHGDVTPFLQVPQGKPTHNLLKMAREGLGFELRNAVHKASKEQLTVIKEHILLQIKLLPTYPESTAANSERQMLVSIEIIPLLDTVEPHYLIRFEKQIVSVHLDESLSDLGSKNRELAAKRMEHLEKELAYLREDMRSITEDMEAANEELQSANEELQSSNEEMQSLNEELETSKEELQSTNEELIIVNQELMDKQDQLRASSFFAESIVSTIREPLLVLDKSLRIKTANASFYKVFQAEELEIEGELFYQIQNHQWDDEVMRSLLEKILPEKLRLTDFEISIHFPGIGLRILLLNALQIVNHKNDEKLILLAIEDVTERKFVERRLQNSADDLENQIKERTASLKKSNEELRQTNVQLDQFAYVASHDLQEPLRKISIFSKRLYTMPTEELSAEVKSYISKIDGAAGRMSQLIQDLLNYSRLLQHEIAFPKTNLNDVIADVLNDFEVLLQEKNARIHYEKLPVIEAIHLQMNQLFYNLVSNALKFSKIDVPSVITITSQELSVEEVAKYPDLNTKLSYVEIIFKDNGIGFEQQFAKKIFTIFQRLHGKELYVGTGIGLALCKKIVENHHGKIFSFAAEDEGASFHLILPLAQS
jgi:two-component system CheB/CheR fusion protein